MTWGSTTRSCGVQRSTPRFWVILTLFAALLFGSGERPSASSSTSAPQLNLPLFRQKKAEPPALFPLEVIWRQNLSAPPSESPAYDGSTVYIPLKTGALVAVALSDGSTRWKLDNVKVTLPPVVDSGRLYLVGEGTLEARDVADGKPLWQMPTPGAISAQPVARGGWVVVAFDNGDVRAMKGETGEKVWELALGGVIRTEPLIVGDRLYLAPEGSLLMAITLMTGKSVWERDLGSKVSSIAVQGDRIIAGTIGRMLFGLDEKRGEVRWRWRIGGDVVGRPAFDSETAYVITLDNTMRAFAVKDGSQHWREPMDFRPLSGPMRVDAVLLVASFSPQFRGYDVRNGKRIGTFGLPIGERAAPAAPPHLIVGATFIDDMIVTATAEGELLAVKRRTFGPLQPISPMPGTAAPAPTVPTPTTTATASAQKP